MRIGLSRRSGLAFGASILLGFCAYASSVRAQTLAAQVETAKSRNRGAGAVEWIGYRAPMVPGRHDVCCDDALGNGSWAGVCRLEGSGASIRTDDTSARGSRIMLEPSSELMVLARLEKGAVTRVRTLSAGCRIETNGVTLTWLTNVSPEDSVTWLASLMTASGGDDRDRLARSALSAIALHDVMIVDRLLITAARDDPRSGVRGQALFWVAWRAGRQALGTITDALEKDPDTEVKKRAVFALSLMPKDEGVPKLIEVARTNRNAAVRQQAMFWLGQSNDPRAVKFFEEILLK